MLDLRPGCEHCDRDLAPESPDARICSFECTYCADCVERVLHNVCPNCGGGFERRPVRPARDHCGPHLGNRPAATERKHKPVDPVAHEKLSSALRDVAPGER